MYHQAYRPQHTRSRKANHEKLKRISEKKFRSTETIHKAIQLSNTVFLKTNKTKMHTRASSGKSRKNSSPAPRQPSKKKQRAGPGVSKTTTEGSGEDVDAQTLHISQIQNQEELQQASTQQHQPQQNQPTDNKQAAPSPTAEADEGAASALRATPTTAPAPSSSEQLAGAACSPLVSRLPAPRSMFASLGPFAVIRRKQKTISFSRERSTAVRVSVPCAENYY